MVQVQDQHVLLGPQFDELCTNRYVTVQPER